MTITTTTDKPAPRPFDREAAICLMRAAGREELIHYAGAAHRDPVAWHVTRAWLDDTTRTESECKERALNVTGWGPITAADIRAANPGMR